MTKNILVLGATGFIGTNLCKRLREKGHFVLGADIKENEFGLHPANHYVYGDLSDYQSLTKCFGVFQYDEIYQLAADMGGAGYIFSGANDANIMQNSAMINLNLLKYLAQINYKGKVFYSSSACIYPEHLQTSDAVVYLKESDAYPANPDSEYGWEKIFSERLYTAYARNYGLNVRIARFHNIFGEYCTYKGGKEKSVAAICRKVIETENGGKVHIWGNGLQIRSFLYIDDCLDAVEKLMESDYSKPINIGSDFALTILDLFDYVRHLSGKEVYSVTDSTVKEIGVRSRCSDNMTWYSLFRSHNTPFKLGLMRTYQWIKQQMS